MKKIYTSAICLSLLLLIEGLGMRAQAQNISVNTTGAANSTLSMFEVLQISTTANTKGIHISHSGAIAGTGYGLWVEKIGASTTNIAGYFSASGGTNNYPGIFMGGNVGIGTTTPAQKLDVAGNINMSVAGSTILGSGSANTYGALTIKGAKNGWAGISFQDAAGTLQGSLMMLSNTYGFYNNSDNNWNYYWNGGAMQIMNTYSPANNVMRMTPNFHLNAMAGYALIANWDNGAVAAGTQEFRVGNGAGADQFYVTSSGDAYTTRYNYAPYFNSSDNSVASGTITGVMVKAGDNFLRTGTAAAVNTFLNGSATGWIQNQNAGAQASANYWISGNGTIGDYLSITSAANGSGNLRFSASNPYIVSSSYFVCPGGAYFNSGTVYTEAQYQCRGGIHNDNGNVLTIAGGTDASLGTYFPNKVGIGTSTPGTSFAPGESGVGSFNLHTTSQPGTGWFPVEITNTSTNNAVAGVMQLTAASGYNALEGVTYGTFSGVFGLLAAASGGGIGVYGVSNSASGWAGYFGAGGVYSVAGYWSSDRRFKKDIKDLPDGTLNKILQLKPSEYYYNTEEYPVFKGFDGKRFGLIAQDLEKIFPEVVENNKPIPNPKRKVISANQPADNVTGYYAVDYVSLIPILIKGMQEQQKMIEQMQKKIDELEKK